MSNGENIPLLEALASIGAAPSFQHEPSSAPAGDDAAWIMLADLRWPQEQRCPSCRGRRICLLSRNVFRCGGCRHEFQIFTGTALENTKASCESIIQAATTFSNRRGERGVVSAIAREARISYKSALILNRKFAECVSGAAEITPALVLWACLASPPSDRWSGYWRRTAKEGT